MSDKTAKGSASKCGRQKTTMTLGLGALHIRRSSASQIKDCSCCKAKPTDKVWCRVILDRQTNTVSVTLGCMLCIQNYVAGDCAMRTSHDFSNFTPFCEGNFNNEDFRRKFLPAVAIKRCDEATDFLRGDVYARPDTRSSGT